MLPYHCYAGTEDKFTLLIKAWYSKESRYFKKPHIRHINNNYYSYLNVWITFKKFKDETCLISSKTMWLVRNRVPLKRISLV